MGLLLVLRVQAPAVAVRGPAREGHCLASPSGLKLSLDSGARHALIVWQYVHAGAFSQMTQMTDPRGNTTTMNVDGWGNTTQVMRPTITSPTTQAITENFTYDAQGRITGAVDGEGRITSFSYQCSASRLSYVSVRVLETAGVLALGPSPGRPFVARTRRAAPVVALMRRTAHGATWAPWWGTVATRRAAATSVASRQLALFVQGRARRRAQSVMNLPKVREAVGRTGPLLRVSRSGQGDS